MGFRSALVLAAAALLRDDLDAIGVDDNFLASVTNSAENCEKNPDTPAKVVVEECWCGGRRTDILVCDAIQALEAMCRSGDGGGGTATITAGAVVPALGASYVDPEEICRRYRGGLLGSLGPGQCTVVRKEAECGKRCTCTSRGGLSPLYRYYLKVAAWLYSRGEKDGAARALGRAVCYAQDAAFPADAPPGFLEEARRIDPHRLPERCGEVRPGRIMGPGVSPEDAACRALANTVRALDKFVDNVVKIRGEWYFLFAFTGLLAILGTLGVMIGSGILVFTTFSFLAANALAILFSGRDKPLLKIPPAKIVSGGARRIEWCTPAEYDEYFGGFIEKD